MPAFEVYDTVVLKADKTLIGTVERNGTSPDDYEPLDETLIIAHVDVPVPILTEFVTTGIPPRGYVFVHFANDEKGSSLVGEGDLLLLNRSFDIGDRVRRDEHTMTGTVVSVSESFILQPICSVKPGQKPTRESFTSSGPTQICAPDCPSLLPPNVYHPDPHSLIYNVPGQELKRAVDLLENDTIIFKNWVGTVAAVEIDVVLALENESIIVISDPYDLHIPIPDIEKPLVSIPEFDNVSRPDFLVALQGWGTTIPISNPRPGYFVVTNRGSLRSGRWIQGSYDAKVAPQGIVLDVVARKAEVHWLTCNAFAPKLPTKMRPPPENISIYEGLKNFRANTDLRRKKDVVVYDAYQQPRTPPARLEATPEEVQSQDLRSSDSALEARRSGPSQDFRLGDHVRFRDTTAAAVKYQGINETSHGQFHRVKPDSTMGWDLNELKVVSVNQDVTTLWQDGTITIDHSNSLRKSVLFELELAPTDLVINRGGMKQRLSAGKKDPYSPAIDFDEMTFFQQPHDLIPEKVGIVQSVDSEERVAKVRWFVKPGIKLLQAGTVLSPKSRFGPIGDVIEDVSLYEIMTFSALSRHLTDVIIMAPPSLSKRSNAVEGVHRSGSSNDPVRINATFKSGHLLLRAEDTTNGRIQDTSDSGVNPKEDSLTNDNDWIGEIIAIGFDGSITVRLCGTDPCRDAVIGHDDIIAIIDNDEIFEGDDIDVMTVDPWGDDEYDDEYMTSSSFSESVEYEGGQRLDADSDDENWVSDDDYDGAADDPMSIDGDINSSSKGNELIESREDNASTSDVVMDLTKLKSHLPGNTPPCCEVLDREPDKDQFGQTSIPSTNASFPKRILREHRILVNGLPEGEIYVRTYENRLDLMRCLIIGPRDTPYEDAPFMVDLHLGPNFPQEPPVAHFHSWTSGLGRVNPNLYEEGKICLSLLGTWPGKNAGEGWSEKATILQILVSLQGLVFVRKPFYNEAGFEDYETDNAYTLEAQQYAEKAYVISRGFVKHGLFRPPSGIEDILAWTYLTPPEDEESNNTTKSPRRPGLLHRLIERGFALIQKSDTARAHGDEALMDGSGDSSDSTRVFLKPLSRGAVVMLTRTMRELETCLAQLGTEI